MQRGTTVGLPISGSPSGLYGRYAYSPTTDPHAIFSLIPGKIAIIVSSGPLGINVISGDAPATDQKQGGSNYAAGTVVMYITGNGTYEIVDAGANSAFGGFNIIVCENGGVAISDVIPVSDGSITLVSPYPNAPVLVNALSIYNIDGTLTELAASASTQGGSTFPIPGLTQNRAVVFQMHSYFGGTSYVRRSDSSALNFNFSYDSGTKLWRMAYEDTVAGSGQPHPPVLPGPDGLGDVYAILDLGDFAINGVHPGGW